MFQNLKQLVAQGNYAPTTNRMTVAVSVAFYERLKTVADKVGTTPELVAQYALECFVQDAEADKPKSSSPVL